MSILAKSLVSSLIVSIGMYVITPIATWYYWDSGLSSIEPAILRSNEDTNLLAIIAMFLLVFWLKFFIYDIIGRKLIHRLHKQWATAAFYTVYALGILVDVFSLFISAKPVVDAGFASLAVILYTPVILAAGNALLIALVVLRARKHR